MDSNLNFDFDFSEAVVIRERINNLKIGDVRAAYYGEKPSVSARDDGENFALDFVLPLPDGCLNVDEEMSDVSKNPASNATVKKYVDSSKPALTLVYASTVGKTAYSGEGLLEGYDLIICYACSTLDSAPSCYCVPLRYLEDTYTSPMELMVADNDIYSTFQFGRNGFYVDKYNGTTCGRVYAIYGVKFN